MKEALILIIVVSLMASCVPQGGYLKPTCEADGQQPKLRSIHPYPPEPKPGYPDPIPPAGVRGSNQFGKKRASTNL